MILVLGQATVQSGRRDEALAISQAHVARSRLEPGCLEHGVHIDSENPNRLVFVERWSDMAALQAHFRVPASRQMVRALAGLCTDAPAMALYNAEALASPASAPG